MGLCVWFIYVCYIFIGCCLFDYLVWCGWVCVWMFGVDVMIVTLLGLGVLLLFVWGGWLFCFE